RGMLARNAKTWATLLDDSKKEFTYTYLYERDGRAEGYLTFRGGKEEETYIREFHCLTARAQRGLLGLLRRHEMQAETFRWRAPGDEPLWTHDYCWDIETRLLPVTMGRVVDVPGALQAWKPDPAERGAVTFAVQDECAPWNTGVWKAAFEDGHVT